MRKVELDFFWLGLGLAAFGFFIGDGLKNFKNPLSKNILDTLDGDDSHELIRETDVHNFIGISKADAQKLVEEYPSIPYLKINNTIYYPKEALRKWLLEIGQNNDVIFKNERE